VTCINGSIFSTNATRARTGIAATALKSGKTAGRAARNVSTYICGLSKIFNLSIRIDLLVSFLKQVSWTKELIF